MVTSLLSALWRMLHISAAAQIRGQYFQAATALLKTRGMTRGLCEDCVFTYQFECSVVLIPTCVCPGVSHTQSSLTDIVWIFSAQMRKVPETTFTRMRYFNIVHLEH